MPLLSILPSYYDDSSSIDTIRDILEENGYPFYKIYTECVRIKGNTILLKLNVWVDNPVFVREEVLVVNNEHVKNFYVDDILRGNFLYKKSKVLNHQIEIEKITGIKIDSTLIENSVLFYYGHLNKYSHFEGSVSYTSSVLRGYMNIHLKYLFNIPISIDFIWNGRDTLNTEMQTYVSVDRFPHFYTGMEVFSLYKRDSVLVVWKYGGGSVYYLKNVRFTSGLFRKMVLKDTLKTEYNGFYSSISFKRFRDTVNISFSYDSLVYLSSFVRKRLKLENVGIETSLFYNNFENSVPYIYSFYGLLFTDRISHEVISISPFYSLSKGDIFAFLNILFEDWCYNSYSVGMGLRYYKSDLMMELGFSGTHNISDYRDINVYLLLKYYFLNM